MMCKHQWAVLDKTVLPSGLEQTLAAGLVVTDVDGVAYITKTVMVICHCTKCGKLKEFTERNP